MSLIFKMKPKLHRWLAMLAVLTIMVPAVGATTVSLIQGTVVHAGAKTPTDPHDDKHTDTKDKEELAKNASTETGDKNGGASDADAEPQNNQKSQWNEALETLSSSVGVKGQTPPAGQATLPEVTSTSALNAWGFMGPANSQAWSKTNNSSWSMSYSSVFPSTVNYNRAKNKQTTLNYLKAAEFAYALQSTGLDKPVKSGFGKVGPMQTALGWGLQGSYYVLHFSNAMFNVLIRILLDVNPLHWIISGAEGANSKYQNGMQSMDQNGGLAQNGGILNNMRQVVITYYEWFTNWGWAIMTMFFAAGLGMAALGITVGQSGSFRGQTKSALTTAISFLKRLFVWVMVPLFAASMYDMCVGNLMNSFSSNKDDITSYAIYGAFVDYGNWVQHSRLGVPSDIDQDGGLPSTVMSGSSVNLSHKAIVDINYQGAGYSLGSLYSQLSDGKNNTDASQMMTSSESQEGATPSGETLNGDFSSSSVSDPSKQSQSELDLLNNWTTGTTITAADYASSQTAAILNGDDGSTLATKLVKLQYNTNGSNHVPGALNSSDARITGDWSSDDGTADVGPNETGGLSTLGLYAYMLTNANDTGLTIANTENLSNDVSLPQHYTVNIVGNGMLATGNGLWALGMMGGLAIIILGYAIEIFKTIFKGLFSIIMGVFLTGFGSLVGGVSLISAVVGVMVGTLGSAFLLQLAKVVFMSMAQYADYILMKAGSGLAFTNFVTFGHAKLGAELGASSVTANTIAAGMNMLYGLFLLGLAFLLLKYRGVIIGKIMMLVEETTNKILATFGNVSGTGSSGTRGEMTENANTGNTFGDSASGLVKQAGMMGLMGGGALAGMEGLSGGVAGKGNKAGLGATGAKNGKAASALGHNASSSDKMGHASELNENKNKNANGNAAGDLGEQNADADGHRLGAKNAGLKGDGHAPAGQGAGQDATAAGKDAQASAKDAQANAKDAQAQTAASNADANSIGNAAGVSQNLADGEQDKDTMAKGLNGQGQGETNAEAKKLAKMAQNGGQDAQNAGNDLANADQDRDAMGKGLSGNANADANVDANADADGSKQLKKLAKGAGAAAVANAAANAANDNSSDNATSNNLSNNDASSIGDAVDQDVAGLSGKRSGMKRANAGGGGGSSTEVNDATNNNNTTQTAGNGSGDLAGAVGNDGQIPSLGGNNVNANGNNQMSADTTTTLTGNNDVQSLGGGTTGATGGANATIGTNGGTQALTGDQSTTALGGSTGAQVAGNGQNVTALGGGDQTVSALGGGTNAVTGGAGQTASVLGDQGSSTLGTLAGNNNTISGGLDGQGQSVTLGGSGDQTASALGDQGSSTLGTLAGNNNTISGGLDGQGQSVTLGGSGDQTVSALGGSNDVAGGLSGQGQSTTLTGDQGSSTLSALGGGTNDVAGGLSGQGQTLTGTTGGGGQTVSALGGSGNSGLSDLSAGGSTLSDVQSQMGNVQSALTDAHQAQDLAQMSPDNSVLQQRAQTAGAALASAQGGAMDAYNSQPVASSPVQAGWMDNGVNGSALTVGAANDAMSGVYGAQQGYQQAQAQYGAQAPQTLAAKDALTTAQNNAMGAGISSDIVSNPQQVEAAHEAIESTENSLKDGTWQPQALNPTAETGHLDSHRTLGI